jgi:2-iminobutanoate/2-iminopropanoate deaminase
MEKQVFDPWSWGKNTNSVQAVEVKNATGTLYCSGQVALDDNGVPSDANMRSQYIYVPFLQKPGIQQATTLLEVKALFATLTVELEATVVK